jgi:hypothetical protein
MRAMPVTARALALASFKRRRGLRRDCVLISVMTRSLSGGHAVSSSEKTKSGLRDKVRQKREARKQRAVERARFRAENQVPSNAQNHAHEKGTPFGGAGGSA